MNSNQVKKTMFDEREKLDYPTKGKKIPN